MCDETRLEKDRVSFNNLNKNIPLHLKVRLLKCYALPALLYGAQAWATKETLLSKV